MKDFRKLFALLICFSLLFLSCEDEGHGPIDTGGGTPGKISKVEVVPTSGGAIVYYTLPTDDDLLYVTGEYFLSNGQKVEAKSSFYKNYIIVEGLGDTTEHTINLYTVNRSEKKSDMFEVKFKPLAPPFWETFESIKMVTAFGGMNIKASNPERENLAYLILMKNIFGEWEPLSSSLYSAAETVNYTIRGYSSDSVYQFGVVLRDRWLNYTDTIFAEIKPLFEEPIPNTTYKYKYIAGDAPRHTSTITANALWDGNIKGWPGSVLLTQAAYTPFTPHLLTIDLGVEAQLSRIHIWDYPEWGSTGQNVYFARGAMKEFEVYGSINYSPGGALDSTWVKLGEYVQIKPSGLPEWSVNNDDIAAGEAGFSWDFDNTTDKFRYLRIRCKKNWEGGSFMALAEIQVYGNASNN